jgi:hypothetical protein
MATAGRAARASMMAADLATLVAHADDGHRHALVAG